MNARARREARRVLADVPLELPLTAAEREALAVLNGEAPPVAEAPFTLTAEPARRRGIQPELFK